MYEIAHEEVIDLPHATAIPILFDFPNVWKIHPLVERVEVLAAGSHGAHGVGATRVCHFYDGAGSVRETITAETPTSFTVELSDMSLPFKSGITTLAVVPERRGVASRIVLKMCVEPKYGLLGLAMTKWMVAPKLRGAVKGLAAGMKVHGEDASVLVSKGGRIYRGTEANPQWIKA